MNKSPRAPEMRFVRVGGEVGATKNLGMAVGEQISRLECDRGVGIGQGAR
jgi:hypothetical protein